MIWKKCVHIFHFWCNVLAHNSYSRRVGVRLDPFFYGASDFTVCVCWMINPMYCVSWMINPRSLHKGSSHPNAVRAYTTSIHDLYKAFTSRKSVRVKSFHAQTWRWYIAVTRAELDSDLVEIPGVETDQAHILPALYRLGNELSKRRQDTAKKKMTPNRTGFSSDLGCDPAQQTRLSSAPVTR